MSLLACQFSKSSEASKKRRSWQEGKLRFTAEGFATLLDHAGAKVFSCKITKSDVAACESGSGDISLGGVYDCQLDGPIAGEEGENSATSTHVVHSKKKCKIEMAPAAVSLPRPPLMQSKPMMPAFRPPGGVVGSSSSSSISTFRPPGGVGSSQLASFRPPGGLGGMGSSSSAFRPPTAGGAGGVGPSAAAVDSVSAIQVDAYVLKKLRPHQVLGVQFMLECLKGKAKVKTKKKHNGAQTVADDDDDDDDFIKSSPSKPSQPASSAEKPSKIFTGCLCADEMGIGKTLQAIAILSAFIKNKKRRAAVVCPSSLIENWEKEMRKWMSVAMEPLLIQAGSKPSPQEKIKGFKTNSRNYVMIISYEMFKKHIDLINEVTSLEVLILDEAHKIKSASENKTTAAMRSCIATRRLLLTGSPIQNNLEELYSLINFAAPGYLGNISSFRRRYVHPIQEGSGEDASSADKQEAKQSADKLRGILSQIMIRRTQSEVLKHLLPPRTDVVLFLRLHEKQESRYDDVANSMIGTSRSWTDKSSTMGEGDEAEEEEVPFVPTEMVLPSLQSLRRIVNYLEEGEMTEPVSAVSLSRALPATSDPPHPHPMVAPQDAQPGNKFKPPPRVAPPILVGVKAAAPAPKVAPDIKALLASSSKLTVLDSLWSVMRTHCPQEKCVVVSNFVTTLEKVQQLAEARGYEALLLQGDVAIDHRQSLVDRFNRASDPAFLFLLSSRAGGVGINLPGGSRLVQMDCDWNPAVDLQAMSRIWRDGQTRKTFIYRLCARGYVEETILQRQYQKGTLVTSCLDDPSAPSIGHVDATAQGEDEPAIAAPKSKRDLEALIFPRYSETTADSNLGKTLVAPYETDPLLQHLLESTAGGELVTDIVECTR